MSLIRNISHIVEDAELKGVIKKQTHTRMATFDVKVDGWEDYGVVPWNGASGLVGGLKAELLSSIDFEEDEFKQLKFTFNPEYCRRRGLTGTGLSNRMLGRVWTCTTNEMQKNFRKADITRSIVRYVLRRKSG